MSKPDKGPQIEEPNNQWKKVAGKKPFTIEGKYIGPVVDFLEIILHGLRTWHIVRRYKTEKQRDQALATLVRKEKTVRRDQWEYRIDGSESKRT